MRKRKNKKGKLKSGTWIKRDMCMSRAYLSLTGFAPQLLSLFLLKRDFTANFECRNCHNLTMTYAELENIFNRGNRNPMNEKKEGISRPRIIRAIDELLAKGFIEIVHQGGAYKQDKTIFALMDDWCFWHKGLVFRKRPKDTRTRGYRKSKKIKVTHETVPIHTHEDVPINDIKQPI
jgi:hypothetical protein